MLGTTVGNYEITEKIGQGGMAVVYIAKHARLDRQAVVKVLRRHLLSDPEITKRFRQEAATVASIRHPGIVEVTDFGVLEDGNLYILMEYLAGENLRDRLDRVRSVPVDSALTMARQAADALDAAHTRNVVHRDLKPANIFLVPDAYVPGGERVKLLDFGIAKLLGDRQNKSLVTRSGVIMGTPVYMSPEQCRGAGEVDHRTDLYALGCILFELLCGRPPFTSKAAGELIVLHLTREPPSARSLNDRIPPALDAAIARLLVKEPEGRFATARELVAALDAISPRIAPRPTTRAQGQASGGETPADFVQSPSLATTAPKHDAPLHDSLSAALGVAPVAATQRIDKWELAPTQPLSLGEQAARLRARALTTDDDGATNTAAPIADSPGANPGSPATPAPPESAPRHLSSGSEWGLPPTQAYSPLPRVAPASELRPPRAGPPPPRPVPPGPGWKHPTTPTELAMSPHPVPAPSQTPIARAPDAMRVISPYPASGDVAGYPAAFPAPGGPASQGQAAGYPPYGAGPHAAGRATWLRQSRNTWLLRAGFFITAALGGVGYLVYWLVVSYPGSVQPPPDPAVVADQGDAAVSAAAPVEVTQAAPSTRYRPALVAIPGGTFDMGSPQQEQGRDKDETPQHPVTLSPYLLCATEVTQRQWKRVMRTNPSHCSYGCFDGAPVQNISWYDAIEYLNRLSKREKLQPCYTRTGDQVAWNRSCTGYRLPTEAEWEYAARAGTHSRFSFGDSEDVLGAYAWYEDNAKGKVHASGKRKPNPWGIMDMYGNVQEWTWDRYELYKNEPRENPAGSEDVEERRVLRGGSFESGPMGARSAIRMWNLPNSYSRRNGLRCARSQSEG